MRISPSRPELLSVSATTYEYNELLRKWSKGGFNSPACLSTVDRVNAQGVTRKIGKGRICQVEFDPHGVLVCRAHHLAEAFDLHNCSRKWTAFAPPLDSGVC
jgi:hypothetical protein